MDTDTVGSSYLHVLPEAPVVQSSRLGDFIRQDGETPKDTTSDTGPNFDRRILLEGRKRLWPEFSH